MSAADGAAEDLALSQLVAPGDGIPGVERKRPLDHGRSERVLKSSKCPPKCFLVGDQVH